MALMAASGFGGAAGHTHKPQRALSAPESVDEHPLAVWTLDSGLPPVLTLGQPPAGTRYLTRGGCSGTGTLIISESDPTGTGTVTVPWIGGYLPGLGFPAVVTDASGAVAPAGPGPYRITARTFGNVTEAVVFVSLTS
jgi:hypothetical protein